MIDVFPIHQRDLIIGIGILLSYIVTVFLGNFVVKRNIGKLNELKRDYLFREDQKNLDKLSDYAGKQSEYLGIVERFFYILVLQSQLIILIPAWFVLKIAVRWGVWNEKDTGRLNFNNFLIGGLLNLVFGLTGYFSISWINQFNITDPMWEVLLIYLIILFAPYLLFRLSFTSIIAHLPVNKQSDSSHKEEEKDSLTS